jgi:hypothetical protein
VIWYIYWILFTLGMKVFLIILKVILGINNFPPKRLDNLGLV